MDIATLHKQAPGTAIKGTYFVRTKSIRQARNGPYLSFALGDREGKTIVARQWQVSDADCNSCEEGEIVDVQATVEVWNQTKQLRVSQLRRTVHQELTSLDFLPKSKNTTEASFAELTKMIADLANPDLRRLMERLFAAEPAEAFKLAPASKLLHQARVGGLLEHTIGVARLCVRLVELYPGMDGDLLLCGALCHDLGKTTELSAATMSLTADGRLLGHTVLGLLRLQEEMNTLEGFPPDLAQRLLHLVASHSGKLEWGAPSKPKTMEAWALHLADMVDSRLSSVRDTLDSAGDGEWVWNELVDAEVWRPKTGTPAVSPLEK